MKKEVQEELKRIMTENARKGGQAIVKKYGTKHMSDIVKKRWAKAKKGVDKRA